MTPNLTHIIRACKFKFKCNQTWDSLEHAKGSNEDYVRHCPKCKEDVHLAWNEHTVALYVEMGYCIAIPLENSILHKMSKRHLIGVAKMRD
jgi:hypothetical protein